MRLHVEVERPSKVSCVLKITVPGDTVRARYDLRLQELQKTAKIKGFRPGHVPLAVVQQFYGADTFHRLVHTLMDESYDLAIRQERLHPVSNPEIVSSCGDHSELKQGQDLRFEARVEILPEIEVKNYHNLQLRRESPDVTDEDIDKVVSTVCESRAELTALDDASVRLANEQFADFTFSGRLLENDKTSHPGLSGTRLAQLGSGELLKEFEDHLLGMQKAETKTFQMTFPATLPDPVLAGKQTEFRVTLNEIKIKKIPALTEEFAKELGYADIAEMREKARESLVRNRKQLAEEKLRGSLLETLIASTPFEVPESLIAAQMRILAQEFVARLREQQFSDAMIQDALSEQKEELKKRAERDVRSELILDAIAKREGIEASPEYVEEKIGEMAKAMKVAEAKLREYYNAPSRLDNLRFRLREDLTVQYLIGKANVKEVSA